MVENERDTMKTWLEEDGAAPWSDDVFKRAEIRAGDQIIRSAAGSLKKLGRPRVANPKKLVSLWLDVEVLEYFRSSGPGWQSRLNDALKKTLGA